MVCKDMWKHDFKHSIHEILQKSEDLSEQAISQVIDHNSINDTIRWYPNGSVDHYVDSQITNTFLSDSYCKKTRWDIWNECITLLKKYDIQINLDVGCANNHFSFLCHANQIFSYGVDPRKDLMDLSNSLFQNAGIETKCAYVGSFATLNDAFISYKNQNGRIFDCVTVMNFLHGNGHIDSEISTFLELLSTHTRYIFISRPIGSESCGVLDRHFRCIESIGSKALNAASHMLYETIERQKEH